MHFSCPVRKVAAPAASERRIFQQAKDAAKHLNPRYPATESGHRGREKWRAEDREGEEDRVYVQKFRLFQRNHDSKSAEAGRKSDSAHPREGCAPGGPGPRRARTIFNYRLDTCRAVGAWRRWQQQYRCLRRAQPGLAPRRQARPGKSTKVRKYGSTKVRLDRSNPNALSHSRTLALSHSRTLALSHSRTLALSHSRTLALSHSRTLALFIRGRSPGSCTKGRGRTGPAARRRGCGCRRCAPARAG
jgi:hypothetical protein